MTRFWRITLTGVAVVTIVIVGCVYALFRGYFDRGRFEIKEFQWSPANQVAMIAERSDSDALGGLEYYVVIGDHVLNSAELRHAYYSNAVVFNAESTCLKVHWSTATKLIIRCEGSTVDRNHINVQKQQAGSVAILYENIAAAQ